MLEICYGKQESLCVTSATFLYPPAVPFSPADWSFLCLSVSMTLLHEDTEDVSLSFWSVLGTLSALEAFVCDDALYKLTLTFTFHSIQFKPGHAQHRQPRSSLNWDSSRYDKISDSGRSANRNRNHKYDVRKFYFSNTVVNTRNSLSHYAVSANMLNCWKSRLDKYWSN